jgi:hypothetical protein
MPASDIPDALYEFVHERAKGRCEYCLTSEEVSGNRCQVDHIIPRSHRGMTTTDNLCLACPACNGHKHARTHAIDSESGAEVPLFDPRRQRWDVHFVWSADGTRVIGLMPTGRATISALKMNDPLIVGARALWVGIGAHPPRE